MRHSLGRIVATAAVAAAVPHEVMHGLLDRHAARDWGDLDAENRAATIRTTLRWKAGSSPVTSLVCCHTDLCGTARVASPRNHHFLSAQTFASGIIIRVIKAEP